MGVAYAKRCSRLQCICVYKFLDSGRFGVGVIAPNASVLGIAPPSGRRVWILLSE